MTTIALLLGDEYVSRYLLSFLFLREIEALGLTCWYLQKRVAALERVQVCRRYPTLFHRQPLFQLYFEESNRSNQRQQQGIQRRLYSFLQQTQCPLFHGLAGRLLGTGYLYQLDNGEWIYNMNSNKFEIDWVDTTSMDEEQYDSDDSFGYEEFQDIQEQRRYFALADEPHEIVEENGPLLSLRQLQDYAEVAVKNWSHLGEALRIREALAKLCLEFESHTLDDSLVYQGAFPVLMHAPPLANGWTSAQLHALLHPTRVLTSLEQNPYSLALEASDCIFSDCAFIDWDHIDDDTCYACQLVQQEAWPPREVMYRWFLPEEVDDIDGELLSGDTWRLGIACIGLFGDDDHWNEYVNIGNGCFVCMLCVRERYVRDPLEYNVCQSFVQPMKSLMLQELQCVRMETYIDNSSIHLFGGTLPSGYFCGVVCYEVNRDLVGRTGMW